MLLLGYVLSRDTTSGAGFYVNATEEPWKTNYRMYSYVTGEVSLELLRVAIVLL